jgi:hypothetical protein
VGGWGAELNSGRWMRGPPIKGLSLVRVLVIEVALEIKAGFSI